MFVRLSNSKKNKIPYIGYIPKHLEYLVELHESNMVIDTPTNLKL